MISIDNLIKSLAGKQFEIDCSEIAVHGILDHHPPLYKGPGVIIGGKKGTIAFRLHNQIETTEEALSSLRPIEKGGLGEPVNQVRVFAKDYRGIDWTGGWAIPGIEYSLMPHFMVNGEFDLLGTRIEKSEGDKKKNVTEIVFGEKLNLPMTELIEERRYRGEEVVFSKVWRDRHEMDFNGARITFFENNADNSTHVLAEANGGLQFTLTENWLAEALSFIRARRTYPRIAIRHFEKDALFFLRNTPSDTRSGMPAPVLGSPSTLQLLWPLFSAYLSECVRREKFGSMELSQILTEVIIASTGTTQAFVLSLAVCVENLVGQLINQLNINVPDKDVVKSLSEHVEKWDGDPLVKSRALGLLTSLRTKPTQAALRILKEQDVVEDRHINAWKKIRPILAHGGTIEYPITEDLLEKQNALISMVYRLALRIIGYKGKITDHLTGALIDLNWRETTEQGAQA